MIRFRFGIACWLSAALMLLPLLLHAATVEDLYETTQPVEGSQDAAFARALETVLVRVSGQRDAPARVGAALANPRSYVQRYGVTQENVLQVGFDDVSIERLLIDAGLPIWGRERPSVLVVLSLEELGGAWLSGEVPPADKERIARAAHLRALPLQWGSIDSQDASLLGMGASSALVQIAERNGANAILVGRGRREALHWILASRDGVSDASGTLEDGVHFAADTFARLFATQGASLAQVNLEVSGITNLDAYASTLNYLESLTLVRAVAVEQVAADTLRLRLAVRGNAQTLQRAIALDDRLIASGASDEGAGATLAFRYQP